MEPKVVAIPQSIHEEGLEFGGIFQGGLVHDGLVLQLLAQGGAVAGGLREELTFHPALVLQEEFLAAFLVEIGPAVPGLEMVRVEDLVAEEVQGQGFDEDGPEGFEEVQCERPAASRAARAWEVICTDSAMMRRSRSRMGISRRTSSRWVASLRPKTWRRSLLRLMRQPC
jgi:hypothetical protein